MTSPIKAIIFDFGNVLLEWNPRHVYQRYFPNDPEGMEHFLEEVDFMNWNAQQDKGRTFADGVALLSRQFPHYSGLIQAYQDNWRDSIGTSYTGTVKLLKELKQGGYLVYGLSNWSAETFPIGRRRFPFLDWFEGIVVSGDERLIKPDPRLFEILIRRYGLDPATTLFIDDSQENVEAAAGLGFIAIRYLDAEALRRDLRRFGLVSGAPR